MPREKAVLVSTTSTLSGIEVKHYLKPVSAHVVAGVDFFSDFAASFTDIFGGRSKTYQNQITTIYNEAIEQLKESAIKVGANAIIGLSVDLDEISGKGKAMFMVTAIGTAVVIENKKIEKGSLSDIDQKIDLEAVEILRRKKEIIDEANSNSLKMADDIWEFIKTNRIKEVSDYLFNYYKKAFEKHEGSEITQELFRTIQSYIDAFPPEDKSQLLYERILVEKNPSIQRKLCGLIKEHNLLDLSSVNRMLNSDDYDLRKLATTILICDKLLYSKEDVKEIAEIIDRITTMFPEKGSYGTKKGLFSSKEKEVWTCSCGKANNNIGETCNSCHKDIYGFTKLETSPAIALESLQEKRVLLTELFNLS